MSRLYTDRTRGETVLIIMNSLGNEDEGASERASEASERANERTRERFAPFRMLLDAAGWWWYPASMHKREWNSRVRSRGETGMSGTSATARLTVTHFRERTKITVSLPKPFPRGERKKMEIAMISHSRRVARSADKSIGKTC